MDYYNYYKQIYNWINGINGEDIIKTGMKSKEEGGVGLIHLEERVMAIKVKSLGFIIRGKWTKEQENIIY